MHERKVNKRLFSFVCFQLRLSMNIGVTLGTMTKLYYFRQLWLSPPTRVGARERVLLLPYKVQDRLHHRLSVLHRPLGKWSKVQVYSQSSGWVRIRLHCFPSKSSGCLVSISWTFYITGVGFTSPEGVLMSVRQEWILCLSFQTVSLQWLTFVSRHRHF